MCADWQRGAGLPSQVLGPKGRSQQVGTVRLWIYKVPRPRGAEGQGTDRSEGQVPGDHQTAQAHTALRCSLAGKCREEALALG